MAVGGGAFAGLLYATGAASDSGALRMTCVALTNTLGLCAIVALLGYGLVEMPREMFKNGNLHTRNERTRMRSADAFKVRSARRRGCLHMAERGRRFRVWRAGPHRSVSQARTNFRKRARVPNQSFELYGLGVAPRHGDGHARRTRVERRVPIGRLRERGGAAEH